MIDNHLFEDVVRIRRDIHQFPETGFDLHRTAKVIYDELEPLGLHIKQHVGKIGIVADLIIPGCSDFIALRADMDALPMSEENDLPYRSQIDNKAHMCGHDGHTAMLIGAAKLLCKEKGSLKQSVRFIFQPCEEQYPGGALGMIEDGCLENVKAIYGLHVWPWLPTGTIGICPGPMLAQPDGFDITITGRGGHAAAPHSNIDPIVIGAQLVGMIHSIISRSVNPIDAAVISITRFTAGSAYNVTPSEATLSGTVRTYSTDCQKMIKRTLQEMVEHTVRAYGATATFNYFHGYPPLINHEYSCLQVQKAAASFLKPDQICSAEKAMFGEDFAYYLQEVPGCFIQLGCRNESKNCINALHHPKFNLDEECLKVGMRLFRELVIHPNH